MAVKRKVCVLSIAIFIHCFLTTAGLNFYDFKVFDADGKIVQLAQYRGKPSLVTNVASYCGYTESHYDAYAELEEEFGPDLNILAFPCNQFGEQEPEDVHTIIKKMTKDFGISFPIFGKVDVTGDNVPDVWRFLIKQSDTTPTWNFFKYLVDADGEVWGAWGPEVPVDHMVNFIRDAVRQAYKKAQIHSEL